MQPDAFVGEGTLTAGPPPDLALEDTMEPCLKPKKMQRTLDGRCPAG